MSSPLGAPMSGTFFTVDESGEWFTGTDLARGPWDPAACHAGPPTALLVRASERAVPGQRLARLAVDLERPVPMAGFRIETVVARAGRATSSTELRIVGGDERVAVRARGLHIAERHVLEHTAGDRFVPVPVADCPPGLFAVSRARHELPMFRDAVEVRYPPGESGDPGPTTLWTRSVELLSGEVMSPFQRVCPVADCTNAFSRHRDGDAVGFVNADLAVQLHRDPVGEWIGSQATSVWEPSGIGVAHALLFDERGTVGLATQTLVLTPA
jgi:Acyl-CoA thioesterase C-terminal domain/Acyl-CoA thioesterase N-terminal domain